MKKSTTIVCPLAESIEKWPPETEVFETPKAVLPEACAQDSDPVDYFNLIYAAYRYNGGSKRRTEFANAAFYDMLCSGQPIAFSQSAKFLLPLAGNLINSRIYILHRRPDAWRAFDKFVRARANGRPEDIILYPPEVVIYAKEHDMTYDNAVDQLVNQAVPYSQWVEAENAFVLSNPQAALGTFPKRIEVLRFHPECLNILRQYAKSQIH